MIVVSNTSPLTNLAAIGRFSLLYQLYAQLHIADGVWHELNANGIAWPGSAEVAAASSWILHHTPQNGNLVTTLQHDLDRGEAETIALALELNADLVLIDERAGRSHAKRLGLNVTGVLGILAEAKAKGLLLAVRPVLDDLRQQANFFIAPRLYNHILRTMNE